MTWEKRLFDLFDDLEQQAEGLARAARDDEVSELGRSGYAEVDLASRIHGSLGAPVTLVTTGLGSVRGTVVRAGRDWCLVRDAGATEEWVVPFAAMVSVRGLGDRTVPEPLRPLDARLGLGSVLRALAHEQDHVVVVRSDGESRRGRLGRVGADFLELEDADGAPEVVPFARIAGLRRV